MTVETMPDARDRSQMTGQLPAMEFQPDVPSVQDGVYVAGALGANAENLRGALTRLATQHSLYLGDICEPTRELPVPSDHFYVVDPEAHDEPEEIREKIENGEIHAVYGSLREVDHKEFLLRQLGYAARGLIKLIVIPKPALRDIAEMREVDAAVKVARASGYEFKLVVHEHIAERGAWHAFREKLPELVDVLGRLTKFDVSIQEARTIEAEGRTKALEEGVYRDLFAHGGTLLEETRAAINKNGRYDIANRSELSMQRFRYEGSELAEGVETGFALHGETRITDTDPQFGHDQVYSVLYNVYASKGAVDDKRAVATFVNDEGIESTITINLAKISSIDAPDIVRHLFPITEFDDDGYGRVVEAGLYGGDPEESFQLYTDARVIIKWEAEIENKKKYESPIQIHPQGVSLEELSQFSSAANQKHTVIR